MNNGGYNSSIYSSMMNEIILTPFGKELFTEEEFDAFKKGVNNLFIFLDKNQLLIEPLDVSKAQIN